MTRTFEIQNVKCVRCAETLIKELSNNFSEVKISLDVEPRQITLELEDSQIEQLILKLRKLGYPLSTDKLNTFQTIITTAKSFVSCAVSKIENSKNKRK